ncbi:MAG: hypothetical protein E3J88_04630 [Anaerolineales bacterium]|nr:MAG: hypothetical protein E3J88_04630 [Anaerolineales bacterium]
MNTRDLFWFWPVFNEQPYEIVLHCYGEDLIFQEGTHENQSLMDLFNKQISGRKNWDSITMSGTTYEYYQTSDDVMVLEFHYPQPVRIHSSVLFFRDVNTLVMPLDGRHANSNAVFGRIKLFVLSENKYEENSTVGSFHVQSLEPLIAYVQSQGLCIKP